MYTIRIYFTKNRIEPLIISCEDYTLNRTDDIVELSADRVYFYLSLNECVIYIEPND